MSFNLGQYHHHKRQRILKEKKEKNGFSGFYDSLIYFIGIGVPIITSSQVFKIWLNQNAQGVSIIAWSAYLFNSIAWLIYGIIHKDKPIIFTNLVCIIINAMVVIGTILYG